MTTQLQVDTSATGTPTIECRAPASQPAREHRKHYHLFCDQPRERQRTCSIQHASRTIGAERHRRLIHRPIKSRNQREPAVAEDDETLIEEVEEDSPDVAGIIDAPIEPDEKT
jgi:hypothetical protein